MEHLSLTNPTDTICMSASHNIPEILSDFPINLITSCPIQIHCTDNLRNMLVCMHILQCIAFFFHRIEKLFIFKKFCSLQMIFFSGQLIDFYHCSKHTTKLTCNIHCPHFIQCFFWQTGKSVIYPVSHQVQDLFCRLISGKYMTII